MDVYKINANLPSTVKIATLNDMLLEINGRIIQAQFDKNEIDQIVSDTNINRKFLRDQSLGHTLVTYNEWSSIHTESGYDIWKYEGLSNYQYNSLNELYLDNKALENRGEANSETATTFNNVFLYNGSTYIDNTTEAGTEDGTSFNLLAATTNYLYVGLPTTFAGISFEFDVRGSNNTLYIEYWNGSVWTDLDISANTYVDDTSNFESDGRIYWTIPGNWATTTVNAIASKYWVRISTTTTPVTIAKAFLIQPANSVLSLLKLSSEEIFNENWAWCSYTTAVYVTLRNAGASAYEGDYFISSSSSSINKQNYFISNHEITADYEDSTYIPGGETTISLDQLADVDIHSGLTNGQIITWNSVRGLWINTTASTASAHNLLSTTHNDTIASTVVRGDLIVGTGSSTKWDNLALGTIGKILRSDGTDLVYSTTTYPNTGTAYRLPVFSATNVMTELTAVGATGEYLAGSTGAIPTWATLNQAAISGLTTAATPTFVGINLTADTNQIVLNSDGGVASITLTGTASTSAKTITFPNFTGTVYVSTGTDIPVTDGGTGLSTLTTAYGLLAAGTTATGAVQTLAAGATTQILVGGGASALPAWGTDLPTAVTIGTAYVYRVSGTDVAVADGGTGKSSWTQYLIPYADTTTSFSQIAIGTSGEVLTSHGVGFSPTFQSLTVTLDSLSDVVVNSGLVDGDILSWDAGDAIWRNRTPNYVRTNTITTNATPSINTNTTDIFTITALAENITSMTTNLSGTPVNGQKLIIRIRGTAARAITWGSKFGASSDLALPTTTTTTKTLYCGFIYNTTAIVWDLVAKLDNF